MPGPTGGSTTINGTANDDVLNGTAGVDIISGLGGSDTIHGQGGNDRIDGGDGSDVISGGAGDDGMRGGQGLDLFQFQAGDGKDTIADLAAGETVEIHGYATAQSITQAGTSVVLVLSAGDQITFQNATLASVQAALYFADATPPVINGTAGPDQLTGTSGDDTINGLGGSDAIDGLAGNDAIAGGSGGDTINGGEGADTIYSADVSPAYNSPYYYIPYHAPALDTGSEADTLIGGGGDDTIFAGYGDNVDGGEQGNYGDQLFISFQGAGSGVTADFSLGTLVVGGGTITGFENINWIQGSNYNDYLKDADGNGHGGGAVLLGMGGDDTLIAGYVTSLLDGGDGNDIVDGRGSQYLQEVDGGDGNDTLYVPANLSAIANGGDGDDIIFGAGTLHGGAGDDTIHVAPTFYSNFISGDAGNDTIIGSTGRDGFWGGTGDDTLSGGGGDDTFRFSAGDGKDVITDFTAGDLIEVADYTQAQSMTQVGSDVVVVFSGTDQITLSNTDVGTVQAGMYFAALPFGQLIYGSSNNDHLNGGSGDDRIEGRLGADVIDGGAGNDSLYSYSAEGLSDAEVNDPDGAHDTLVGGAGDDFLNAGYGDDVDGGTGVDTLFLSLITAPTGVTLDTASFLAGTVIGGATIQNVENLQFVGGTDFADTLTVSTDVSVDGEGGSDVFILNGDTGNIYGGGGDDVFIAGDGFHGIEGGDGDDTLVSGAGIDSFSGGEGIDTVDYRNATSGVSVDFEWGNGAGGDSFSNVENATGSAFGDTLGGDYRSNFLSGAGGNDTLHGGWGNDTLTGGGGTDTFLFAKGDGQDIITDLAGGEVVQIDGYASAVSITQIGSDVVVRLSSSDQITFQNVDLATVQAGLQFTAPPPITLNGTSGADTLTGGAGNDTLNGLGGNDTLNGGTGGDVMKGGTGNDIYYVDDAGDKVMELAGQGIDTVHSTVGYTLGANVENGVLEGTFSVELIGNSLANVLIGNDGDNFLYGMAGSDKLIGGAGNDLLRGGLGADTLTGGLGGDTFMFERGGGSDKVTDFVSGTDTIDLSLIAGITSADLKIAVGTSGTVISVDADHNGRADFTITLIGVSHVATGDFIFA
nr:calcium-binding protein [Sphingomonas sp. URHD0057]